MREKPINAPVMHCQNEIEKDLVYDGFLPDETLMSWYRDSYSTSKHLLTLYSLVQGLKAQNVLEIGFGRSSFILMKALSESGGKLTTCDHRNFSYLLSKEEKEITNYKCCRSDQLWTEQQEGYDFAFLDYFSNEKLPSSFCEEELQKLIPLMKTNGIIAIHDTYVEKYGHGNIFQDINAQKFSIEHIVEFLTIPYNYGMTLIRCKAHTSWGTIVDGFIKKQDTSI